MVSGTHLFDGCADESDIKITSKMYLRLEKLIKHALKENHFCNKYPKYVNDTFAAFVSNKKNIVLNLAELFSQYCLSKTTDTNLSNLIMNELSLTTTNTEYGNLFQPVLLKLFKNIKNLTIFSSTRRGRTFLPFSVSKLLSLINELVSSSNGITITIKTNQTLKNQWKYDRSKLGEWVVLNEKIKENVLRSEALLGKKRNPFTYNRREQKGKIILIEKEKIFNSFHIFFSIICGNNRILKVSSTSEHLQDDSEYKDSRIPTKSWLTEQCQDLPFHTHNWYLQYKNTTNVFGQKEDCIILKFGRKDEQTNEDNYETKSMEYDTDKVLCSYDCHWAAKDNSILILHTKNADDTFSRKVNTDDKFSLKNDICKVNAYSESWKICCNGNVYRNNRKRLLELGESDLLENKITTKNMEKLKSYLQKLHVNIREIDNSNNYTYSAIFYHECVQTIENLNEVDFDVIKAVSSFIITELGFRFPIRYDNVDRKTKKMYIQKK
eukprot:489915_1